MVGTVDDDIIVRFNSFQKHENAEKKENNLSFSLEKKNCLNIFTRFTDNETMARVLSYR